MAEDNLLLAVERQRIIRELLEREGIVRNAELKQMLRVSAVTIRSDLRELEAAGICEVIWGGAVYRRMPPVDRVLSLPERVTLNAAAKQRIGAYAAGMVEAGQTILVDAGTTTVELIHHLSRDLEYLRVVTPALNVAAAAVQFPNVELVMTGGILRNLTRSLFGPQTLQSLALFNADLAFIATGGFTAAHGVTTSNLLEVEVKRAMMARAARSVILADSSKFGTVLSLRVAPLSEFASLITDEGLSPSDASELEETGVRVIRV